MRITRAFLPLTDCDSPWENFGQVYTYVHISPSPLSFSLSLSLSLSHTHIQTFVAYIQRGTNGRFSERSVAVHADLELCLGLRKGIQRVIDSAVTKCYAENVHEQCGCSSMLLVLELNFGSRSLWFVDEEDRILSGHISEDRLRSHSASLHLNANRSRFQSAPPIHHSRPFWLSEFGLADGIIGQNMTEMWKSERKGERERER